MNKNNKYIKNIYFGLLILFLSSHLSAQENNEKADKILEKGLLDLRSPGISASVSIGDKIVYSSGKGFADLENKIPATGKTIYRIASISKPITSIAILQLIEKGLLNLSDDIRKHVPAWPEKRWSVNIKHILTYTSGITHYRQGESSRKN